MPRYESEFRDLRRKHDLWQFRFWWWRRVVLLSLGTVVTLAVVVSVLRSTASGRPVRISPITVLQDVMSSGRGP